MLVSDEPNSIPLVKNKIIPSLLQPVFEFAEKKWGCKVHSDLCHPLFPTSSTSRHACSDEIPLFRISPQIDLVKSFCIHNNQSFWSKITVLLGPTWSPHISSRSYYQRRLCRTIPQLVYPTSARFQVCREKEVAVRLDLCLQFQHPLLAAMLVSDEPNPLPCPEIIILLQPVFEFAEKKWGCKSIQTCAAPLFPTSSTSRHACSDDNTEVYKPY
jgi:hypothetical protein